MVNKDRQPNKTLTDDELLACEIEIEKNMTFQSTARFYKAFKNKDNFQNSTPANIIISENIDKYVDKVQEYLNDYSSGKAVRTTIAAKILSKINVKIACYIAFREILSGIYLNRNNFEVYSSLGKALEAESKMQAFKNHNTKYYSKIQKDLNKRNAKNSRKKTVTQTVFNKKLDFHFNRWAATERTQTAMILVTLFLETFDFIKVKKIKKENHKQLSFFIATENFKNYINELAERLAPMNPIHTPMVVPPKPWTGIFDGGYISPYIRRNKFIKNNDKKYIKDIKNLDMPLVYEAVNHLQSTEWKINKQVLNTAQFFWDKGISIAEIPNRDDKPLIPFPFPNLSKNQQRTPEQIETIKKWKLETYDIHKSNVQVRSNRLSVYKILEIAKEYSQYEKIFFPYQMDFRGRMYPIPVLLQPQGSDLAKGLLCFAEGKPLGEDGLNWLKIHGANVYGYDKASYKDRIKWVDEHIELIKKIANNPIDCIEWGTADKPFQFLSFCFEYASYLNDPNNFVTRLPIQLDGTCNGIQHYSALLKDEIQGKAVNLINSDKPNDIYQVVAEKLITILQMVNEPTAKNWINLGINRKLTKRPVMVLPYGGTIMSTRKYIEEYLTENYSKEFIYEHFNIGNDPNDCTFKASQYLSKYLWQAIVETLNAATSGMAYLKSVIRLVNKENKPVRWTTPMGLIVEQNYKKLDKYKIQTELFGKVLSVQANKEAKELDKNHQLNGICPNFIHSLDAACLMSYLLKCKKAGISNFMTVHDSYGTYACYTTQSAKFLREAFVEIYKTPVLENFTKEVLKDIEVELPQAPAQGQLDINNVLESEYFFN